MSAIPVYTEMVLRRDQFVTDLRSMAQEVQNTARTLSATKIDIKVAFRADPKELQRQLDAVQRQVKPIVVPVIYQPQGMPGGGMGGGGMPMGTSSPNWSYYFGQLGQQIGGLQQSSSPNWSYLLNQGGAGAGGAPGGGGGRGAGQYAGMFGIPGLRSIGTLAAAHFAYRNINDVAEEVGAGFEGANLGRLRDPMDQLKRKRALIESEHSGLRGGMNWIYGKLGLQPTYDEETGRLDEAERADQLADQREKATRRAVAERTRTRETLSTMGREIVRGEGGGIAGRRADISDALRKHEEAAQHIEDAWQTLGYKTYQEAQRVAGQIRVAGRRIATAQTDAANRAEFGLNAQTAVAIGESYRRAGTAAMRAQGRTTEVGYLGATNAVNDRLTRLGIAYQSEADPQKRMLLGQQYQAELVAGGREIGAIQAGYRRETIETQRGAEIRGNVADLQAVGADRRAALYARNAEIDERARRLREERDATKDPFVRGQLTSRLQAEERAGGREKAANEARDARQREDQIASINEAASRMRLSITRRDLGEELRILEQHYDRRIKAAEKAGDTEEAEALKRQREAAKDAAKFQAEQFRLSTNQRARDIALRAVGAGGLADEYGIEGELARNLKESGKDVDARRASINLARAQLFSYVKGESRPQFFGSNEQYVRSIQEGIFNQSAEGLKRAQALFKRLDKAKGGGPIEGEADLGLGPQDFTDFKEGSVNLNKAAQVMLQNPIGVIRR